MYLRIAIGFVLVLRGYTVVIVDDYRQDRHNPDNESAEKDYATSEMCTLHTFMMTFVEKTTSYE